MGKGLSTTVADGEATWGAGEGVEGGGGGEGGGGRGGGGGHPVQQELPLPVLSSFSHNILTLIIGAENNHSNNIFDYIMSPNYVILFLFIHSGSPDRVGGQQAVVLDHPPLPTASARVGHSAVGGYVAKRRRRDLIPESDLFVCEIWICSLFYLYM